MDRHLLVVLTKPVEGKEDEYNEWYSSTHLDDVLAIDGFVSAQRFALTELPRPQQAPYRYLAIYEIEGDPEKARRALREATRGEDSMELSDALDWSDVASWYFTPVTERRSTS